MFQGLSGVTYNLVQAPETGFLILDKNMHTIVLKVQIDLILIKVHEGLIKWQYPCYYN